METFAEIEAKFQGTPVRFADYPAAAGTLALNGVNSHLDVTSGEFFWPERDHENGWFDLDVIGANGTTIHLHNAISVGSSEYHWGEDRPRTYSNSIFPNMVVLDRGVLDADGNVSSISFQLEGFRKFFHYQHTELVGIGGWTDDQIAALRSMQVEGVGERGPFAPREVFIVHEVPEFFEFRVDDRQYSIWAGGKFQGGAGYNIAVDLDPIATIKFDQPLSLDAAVQHVWDWRCFFCQVAMSPLNYVALRVGRTLDGRDHTAPLYLPNFEPVKPLDGLYAFSPRYAPLCEWEHRTELANVMQTWLSKSDERRAMRGSLNYVIADMQQRINPTDLVTLSAAVEGIADLAASNQFASDLIESMAVAATQAAKDKGATIEQSRIKSLLGALARPSLSKRIASLGEPLHPPIVIADAEKLSQVCARGRNEVAHGKIVSEQLQPSVSYAVQALAALLARRDLETCGMPIRSPSGSRTIFSRMFDDAIEQLRTM